MGSALRKYMPLDPENRVARYLIEGGDMVATNGREQLNKQME